MIHTLPSTVTSTMNTPNASAMMLLVLSGPVVMWRKKARWTPICAIANTISAAGIAGAQTSPVVGSANDSDVLPALFARRAIVPVTHAPDPSR